MKKRRICVWSGKRGGFGAFLPTMQEIARRPGLELSLVVTDQHLYEKFGKTIKEVTSHFDVTAAIDMEQKGDAQVDRAMAIGTCLVKAAPVLDRLRPDVLLVIGDRGEVLAASIAAHNLRIAIAHVQGGDISGTLDEPVRHAVTKLSHIHFPSTKAAAERILRMGEEPWRVHAVGDTHVDQILLGRPTDPEVLRGKYELPADRPFILALQHSDSTVPHDSARQMSVTLDAVLSFGLRTLLVYPCSDQGYEGIITQLEAARGRPGVTVHENIPAEDFVGLQAMAGCLVGNSSAGLIEAPYFALPAVNVGDRQIGRERSTNVIDAPYEAAEIRRAIDRALHDRNFRTSLRDAQPPFGDGTAYRQITDVLESIAVDERLLNKRMTY